MLRDPAGVAEEPVLLTPAGAFLATRLDGHHTLAELQAELCGATGARIVPLSEIEELVADLDRHGLLEGPIFEAKLEALRAAWDATDVRPPSHAGGAYPADPARLRKVLAAYYEAGPGGTPKPGRTASPDLQGLFAPHIDPPRGGHVIAHAYHALVERAPDADLFILVGTSHSPCHGRVALTRKHYGTPLGTLRTHGPMVERLASYLPGDPFQDELNHKNEHSLEFQALFLVHALIVALGEARLSQVSAVPVLIGSFHDFVQDGADPTRDPTIEGLVKGIAALIEEHEGRTVVIGGVDLAHLGVRFGGDRFDESRLAELETEDRAFLERVVRGDHEAVFADVARDHDGRNYCGFPALWVMCRALGLGAGEVLGYDADLTDGAVVSFGAGVLARAS